MEDILTGPRVASLVACKSSITEAEIQVDRACRTETADGYHGI